MLAEIFVPAANFVLAGIFVPAANFVLAGIFVPAANFASRNFCNSRKFLAGSKFFASRNICVFVCFAALRPQVNNYGHGETDGSPNHIFPREA